MEGLYRYYLINMKRMLKLLPAIIAGVIFLCCCVLSGIYVLVQNSSTDHTKLKIGVVGEIENSYLEYGITALQSMDSTRYIVELTEVNEDEATSMVKKGELTVEQGKVLNKELKHNLKNTIKNNVNVSVKPQSGEELEELLGNMTPDQLADLKDKISQMQEKDAAESENEEVDKDADVDDASKDADTDDTDAAEGAAEKTVTADTKSE